jgi:hypothetical protein
MALFFFIMGKYFINHKKRRCEVKIPNMKTRHHYQQNSRISFEYSRENLSNSGKLENFSTEVIVNIIFTKKQNTDTLEA